MNSTFRNLTMLICFVSFAITTIAQSRTNPNSQPEELGTVSWYRNYEQALTASKKENKPVLILFQEIPGCSTCKNYGNDVLSNPLLADAIENEFIPLAIYNNKGGKDREILKLYNEPTWNNPVVRIVTSSGADIIPRVSGNYSAKGLYASMNLALNKEFKEIPAYFKLLGKELSSTGNKTKDAYYSMYCFWTGEKQLGSQEGVLNTEAGFMSGHEVVKVTYNEGELDKKALDAYARANKMKSIPQAASYRWAQNDEDYYLQHTDYKYLPLTPLQRTKINSALGNRKSGVKYLSPSQLEWLSEIQNNRAKRKEISSKDFKKAWLLMAGR